MAAGVMEGKKTFGRWSFRMQCISIAVLLLVMFIIQLVRANTVPTEIIVAIFIILPVGLAALHTWIVADNGTLRAYTVFTYIQRDPTVIAIDEIVKVSSEMIGGGASRTNRTKFTFQLSGNRTEVISTMFFIKDRVAFECFMRKCGIEVYAERI